MNPSRNPTPYYNSEYQWNELVDGSPLGNRGYGTISTPTQNRRALDPTGRPFQAAPGHGETESRAMFGRYERPSQQPFMLDQTTTQAWSSYDIATVNGAMNGANRYRQATRRAAIPTNWTNLSTDVSQALPSQSLFPMNYPGPMNMHGYAISGVEPKFGGTPVYHAERDQIIPTAIVIKNIPFKVRKEQLAQLMVDMHLPQPYAFNYHFDNGVFRGLAFANFQTPEDTRLVIDSMNQLELEGRKLRVEYKKMLPEHERERIEREKREKRGQLQEQHQPLSAHQQSGVPRLEATIAGSSVNNSSPLRDVDLNNPETLGFYTELTLFKNDNTRETMIFPSSISPEQRRQIHILAHNLGMQHQSIGDGDQRQLQVLKRSQVSPISSLPNVSYDHSRRGLSRAATIDFAESRMVTSGTGFHPLSRPGPTLEVPGSSDLNGTLNNLRAAKSFADLRSYSPSPAPSTSSIHHLHNSLPVARYGEYGASLNNRNASPSTSGAGASTNANQPPGTSAESSILNLASMSISGYDSTSNLSRPRENPGAIGSQRPSVTVGPSTARGVSSDWETGFMGMRTNGHVPRGSGECGSDSQETNNGNC